MFLWNIIHRPNLIDVLDILIIAFLLYRLVVLTKQTRANQVLKGLAILLVLSYLSELIGFTSLSWLMRTVLNNGALLIVILYQPELRRALEQVGSGAGIERTLIHVSDNERIVNEITQCCLRLSKRRVGALIVFEQKTGLREIEQTGIAIDAVITSALLENIFEPNTPLHDGAVMIRDQRVVTAACVLTLSESSALSKDLGTRHRAALGVSESSDAVALIISEETGIISMARGGRMTRHLDAESLRGLLSELYAEHPSKVRGFVDNMLKKRRSSHAE
ncbi:MAG: diadenylate cyclase CdaA [Clostridia bacterium]|nr:diadenylate cyclase CdaA [Clostridia bacterium]